MPGEARLAGEQQRGWSQEHYNSLYRRKSVEKLVDGVELPPPTRDANGDGKYAGAPVEEFQFQPEEA
ncbi:hypothetical protein [Streptomyces sp. GC420]|uniref:hypothetical protein n=1 Tax=Streptomyces sp. GC420 TaxID=2697568 RepID=UPI001414E401|nr:hypothetical protein [Streptomyces sp. GC420]NBM20386.1 hypothetical protein [Streptomyces sp. GC420]